MLILLIKEKELCVCSFMKILNLSQSKASRHLRYMYNAGLLEDRQSGLWVYYRISSKLSPEAKLLIKSFKTIIKTYDFDHLFKKLNGWLKCCNNPTKNTSATKRKRNE